MYSKIVLTQEKSLNSVEIFQLSRKFSTQEKSLNSADRKAQLSRKSLNSVEKFNSGKTQLRKILNSGEKSQLIRKISTQ